MGRQKKESNESITNNTEENKPFSDSLIMSISELNQLTDQQKQEFRAKGGTATQD